MAGWQQEVAGDSGDSLRELTDAFEAGLAGGKLLRGSLVKLGYELVGGRPDQSILTAAAAYEILHGSLLVHDDCMDRTPVRRGRPAVYQALGGGHYGFSQAVALGDAGFFLAGRILASAGFDSAATMAALELFHRLAVATVTGQMLDLQLARPGAARRSDDVLRMHELKTGRYSVIGPLQLGALLGGAKTDRLDRLAEFGRGVGLAYQIQDDILGVFADAAVTGKSVQSDIEENKSTLLLTYATEHGTPEQLAILKEYYGQGPLPPPAARRVRAVFEDCGALEHSRRLARQYVESSTGLVPELTADPQLREVLTGLAAYALERNK